MGDKSGCPQPKKNSGKNPRVFRQSSVPVGSVGNGETGDSGASGRNRRLASIRPRISIDELRNVYRRQASQTQEETEPVFDPLAKAQGSINVVRGRTGVVYDKKMAEHRCLWDQNYPEAPERLLSTLTRCEELGLLDRCERLNSRAATEEEVLQLHSRAHLGLLSTTKGITDQDQLEDLSSRFDSIYLHPSTCDAVLLSAGSTLVLVDAVISGKLQNGFAIVRPPGHHALESEFVGFSYINNVALAARRALDHHKLSRILIVDWDVHHGQATQRAFYNDPRLLYFSIHRYENGSFWPNLRESNYDHAGEGTGRGYTFNLPLNTTGLGNSDYLAALYQVLLPVAYEFNPDLVLVSSGYDAALGCPEGEMKVSPGLYSHLTSCLMTLAQGKIAIVLEGGYCYESLAEGAAMTLSALLGDPCPPLLDPITQPSPSMQESILNLIYVQRAYWKCFQYQGSFSGQLEETCSPGEAEEMKGEKTAEVGKLEDQAMKGEGGGGAGKTEAVKEKERKEGRRSRHTPSLVFHGSTDKPPIRFQTRNLHNIQPQDLINKIQAKLTLLREKECVSVPPRHKLCLAYDPQMGQHRNLTEGEHPERPERIERVWECFKHYGIVERATVLQSRRATQEEVELVHTRAHVDFLSTLVTLSEGELQVLQEGYKSIYLHPTSNDCALLAAGCMLQIVDSVCTGESNAGVGVVRPPGHHAEPHTPHGFCFYNNIAVAAKYALTKHNLQRVLILDWDVHHGNGVQHAFYSDPRVLYVSIHRYDHAFFFPSSEDANYDCTGEGPGEGYNINIPWNKNGMGDAEYLAALAQVVLPVAYQFNPQLVLISAGFDAARGDPLGGCRVSPECFGHMTQLVSSLAGGRLILALEGGYSLSATSHCLTMCAKALLGDPLPPLPSATPNKSAIQTINDVLETHKQYWPVLCFQVDLPLEDVLSQGLGGGAQPADSGVSASDASSSNTSPASSPSTASSSPYVSAPSSPEKIQDTEESAASTEKNQVHNCVSDGEMVSDNLTPQRSVRERTRKSSNTQEPASGSETLASLSDSAATAEQCQSSPSSGLKKKLRRRSGRQEGSGVGEESSTPKQTGILSRVQSALMVAATSVDLMKGPTAIIFSEACCGADVQGPGSMTSLVERCKELGLWQRCAHLAPYQATRTEILAVHTQEVLEDTLKASARQCAQHPVPINHILSATGSVVTLVREVVSGCAQNGLALVQSGRHPLSDKCVTSGPYLDNVAIAVCAAVAEFNLKRVLIVEWLGKDDRSIQNIFEDNSHVLVFSLHLHPSQTEGKARETERQGHNISIRMDTPNLHSEDYYSLFFQVLLPVAYDFSPELVVVSASHQVSHHSAHLHPILHWHQTGLLASLAQGRMAVVLELGQYDEAVAENVSAILCSLQDMPLTCTHTEAHPPSLNVQAAIMEIMSGKQACWNSLKYHAQTTIAASYQPREHSVTTQGLTEPHSCTAKNRLDVSSMRCASQRVCLGWEEATREHWNQAEDTHPERPQRLTFTMQRLIEFGLTSRCHKIKGVSPAGKGELGRVHTERHLKFMQSLRSRKPSDLRVLEEKYESIYFHRRTDHAATLAAGSTLAVVENVLKGESQRGMAVVRPPGHHAEKNRPCGFCFYNNVAVAAMHAIEVYKLQRVLILDWDVHHGNGTQHSFEDDPRVLYVSIHRYDHATFFPGRSDANYDRVGVKKGQGYNINIPWNKGRMGDGDYMAAMLEVVMPVCFMYNPELVLVSAGFDAAVGDPLGGCQVTPECYGHMTRLMTCLAGGKVVLVLEGGYNLSTLSYCVTLCTKALLGDPIPPLQLSLAPCQSAVDTLANVVSVHSKFWSALNFKSEGKIGVDVRLPEKKTSNVETSSSPVSSSTSHTTSDDVAALAADLERVVLSDGPAVEDISCKEAQGYDEGACGEAAGGGKTLMVELAAAEQLYAVVPATWCPHLEQVQPLPDSGLDTSAACQECHDPTENWLCLTCYKVLCGRFVNEHMLMHGVTEQHFMVLSYSDLSAWCYACDLYVHNPILFEAKRMAHLDKFGEDIPGSS